MKQLKCCVWITECLKTVKNYATKQDCLTKILCDVTAVGDSSTNMLTLCFLPSIFTFKCIFR